MLYYGQKFTAEKESSMKTNMGSVDRIIRIVLAAVVAVLYFTKQLTGTAAIILGILAIIFVLTSFVGVCPLYMPFGISTKKKQKPSARERDRRKTRELRIRMKMRRFP
jgi:small-conductance mechanosensitive channel